MRKCWSKFGVFSSSKVFPVALSTSIEMPPTRSITGVPCLPLLLSDVPNRGGAPFKFQLKIPPKIPGPEGFPCVSLCILRPKDFCPKCFQDQNIVLVNFFVCSFVLPSQNLSIAFVFCFVYPWESLSNPFAFCSKSLTFPLYFDLY